MCRRAKHSPAGAEAAFGCENPSAVARCGLRFECLDAVAELPYVAPAAPVLATLELPTETPRHAAHRPHLGQHRLPARPVSRLELALPGSRRHRLPESRPATKVHGRAWKPIGALSASCIGAMRTFAGFAATTPAIHRAISRGRPWRAELRLLVKDHAGATRAPLIFDLDQVQAPRPGEPPVAAVPLDRNRRPATESLRTALPGERIAPQSGARHRRRCLTALALFGMEAGDAAR